MHRIVLPVVLLASLMLASGEAQSRHYYRGRVVYRPSYSYNYYGYYPYSYTGSYYYPYRYYRTYPYSYTGSYYYRPYYYYYPWRYYRGYSVTPRWVPGYGWAYW